MSNIKIQPRCVNGGRDPAFTIGGYFLPCCWVDNLESKKIFEYYGFFQEEFFIDNLKTSSDIKELFESQEWKDFYNMLSNNPAEAPMPCKRHCGVIDNKIRQVTQRLDNSGNDVALSKTKLIDLVNYD